MATGSEFFWFPYFLSAHGRGEVFSGPGTGFDSRSAGGGNALVAIPVSDSYNLTTASARFTSQIRTGAATWQSTANATLVPEITLTGVTFSQSGTDTVKFDAGDIDPGFSQAGNTIASFKYLVIAEITSTAGGADNDLMHMLGYFDMDTSAADASVGGSTVVTVAFNAGGIGKLRPNP